MADKLQRELWAADQLISLLASVEAPPIDETARQRLERLISQRVIASLPTTQQGNSVGN
jgi:hypothetical protein